MFSKIASHISEVSGSHGHNVVNGFKVLCGDAPPVSLVGVVKGFTVEDAKFIDTHCNRSAVQNWALWWLRPSHLQILHVDFSPMIDHVWEKCPDNANAVERKNRDAKDNVPVPIFTNWTNHTVLNTLQQTKDVAFHTQVGVVNPEQKQLHEVRCKQRRFSK